jgi:hypothetical protein
MPILRTDDLRAPCIILFIFLGSPCLGLSESFFHDLRQLAIIYLGRWRWMGWQKQKDGGKIFLCLRDEALLYLLLSHLQTGFVKKVGVRLASAKLCCPPNITSHFLLQGRSGRPGFDARSSNLIKRNF